MRYQFEDLKQSKGMGSVDEAKKTFIEQHQNIMFALYNSHFGEPKCIVNS